MTRTFYPPSDPHDDDSSHLLSESQSQRRKRTTNVGDVGTTLGQSNSAGCHYWMPFISVMAILAICCYGILYLPSHRTQLHDVADNVESANITKTKSFLSVSPPTVSAVSSSANDSESAGRYITDLLDRQSHTLEQAQSRYMLKTGREPPPNFNKWFALAQENKCLIDNYDRIDRDFEPFYQLAKEHPRRFRQMLDKGQNIMLKDPRGMTTIRIREGKVELPDYTGTSFDKDLQQIVQRFSHILPNTEFMLNGRDEPRVAFNVERPNAHAEAILFRDPDPFRIAPVPTAEFFRKQPGCYVSQLSGGFLGDPIDQVAFFASSSSSDFTVDLWPMLSMAKISPCFSDILFPSVYYYDSSWWSGKFAYPDNVQWKSKKPIAYWRGMSNGGHIYGENYRRFSRFRLVELSRAYPDLIDARLTRFAETQCTTEDCDRDQIIEEYNITGDAPREDVYQYKYALDVDGNSFSGRYLGLLRSGSLVFKSTAFEEYFSDWLRPFVHFIPVRPDLSDLAAKVAWARTNDQEARRIQQRGWEFATQVMTDRQNDCYFARVLLEWARLANVTNTVVTSNVEGQNTGSKSRTKFVTASKGA
ncbi:CAP10 domain-containing protein [Mycena indigotica]|uniref:CAP10 domain-containing protein n=1 Tax=Mycena indigotica TaxID=2126181 RepID=A0A8H6SED7_9AGAR|nr:CAP10 domain-containing protein [Mycena indigotica]KAF7297412.1 CAP10 domain-containing protein [Mycena indigotica]